MDSDDNGLRWHEEELQSLIMGNQDGFSIATRSVSEQHAATVSHQSDSVDISSTADLARTPSHTLSTSPRQHYRVYKRRFLGLVILILLNIIVSWDWIAVAAVARTAATYFSVSETAINWLSTSFLFAFVFATPSTLYLLSRYGPKASIITSATLLLVGNWIKYAGTRTNTFAVVMLGQLLIGFAQPFVLAAPTTYSDIWFSPAGRTTATALASLSNAFGAAIGQLVSPFWVTSASDVPSYHLYLAIIATGICVPSFFIPRHPPTPPSPQSETLRDLNTPSLSTVIHELRALLSSIEFWLVFISFSVYVGFFNAFSSLLSQILTPYGFTEDQAGIAGAVLIVVGLISAAITSPLNDKYKFYLGFVRVAVPAIALMYLIFYWAPPNRSFPYILVVVGILGAASFSLVPLILEFLVEILYPIGPSVSSSLCWSGGQLLGGVFIVIMDALKEKKNASPPYNMQAALLFQAVVAMLVLPLPLCLGLFGRRDMVRLRRLEAEKEAGRHDGTDVAPADVTTMQ